eukprot:scaffold2767_cov177-Amphora_coffeaeformis.AAC.72
MSEKHVSSSLVAPEAVILDVPFLDEFFLEWVIDQSRRILHRLGSDIPSFVWSRILLKYLRPITHCMVLLTTHGQTPATRLLGLQRTPAASNNSQTSNKNHLRASVLQRDHMFRLACYTIFSTIIPTVYAELKEWHRQRLRERHARESTRPIDETNIEQVSAERKFNSLDKLIRTVSRVWPMLRLTALLGVWSGRLGTSEIAMIMTGWTYQKQPARLQQHEQRLHVDYAQRRWIWEEAVRSLRVWGQGLSLIAIWKQDLQIWMEYFYGLTRLRTSINTGGEHHNLQKEPASCCFCEAKPIVVPLKLHPCGHCACYACLHKHRKSSVRCRLCRLRVVDATRLPVSP